MLNINSQPNGGNWDDVVKRQRLQGPFSSQDQSQQGRLGKLEPEFQPAYQAWQANRNKSTTGQLLKSIDPVLNKAVHSYGGSSRGNPVLKSRARKLALDAMESYNPVKGTLKTHLLSRLQRLQRVAAQQQQGLSVPEQVVLDKQHLIDTENELADKLGRDPADQEIADFTGLSLKRLAYVRKAHVPLSEGSVLDRPGVPESEQFLPASKIPGQTSEDDAWADFVYADLGTKDQAIMDYMLGLHGSPRLSMTETAKRVGLSVGAISQRAAKIQKMLDEKDDLGLLG